MIRWLAVAFVVLVAALSLFAWRRSVAPAPNASMPPSAGAPAAGSMGGAEDPGVHWTRPSNWDQGGDRPMRLATYVPAGTSAECAVFYFGEGQGGNVDDNVDRWVGQFSGAPNPRRVHSKVNGLEVTRVEVRGTYLDPGMDMKSQGERPDWMLLGAIVQGPHGPVFFKFTGPAAEVSSARHDFDAMLAGIHPL
jgi:hypothetical protein